MDDYAPLQVIAFAALMAFVTECLQYYFVYSTPAFQSVKANLSKQTQKVEAAKEQAARNVKKREARLHGLQQEAGKVSATVQFKTALIAGTMLMVSFKAVPAVFGKQAVAHLPFQPPAFLQRLTHRGLEDADPQQCSATFLFMLCQGSVKVILGKLLGWGPSREMQSVTLTKTGKQA